MNILIRMPNWIGDGVMATPALTNLRRHFPDAAITLLASRPVAELFKPDPAWQAVVVDASKASRVRLTSMHAAARALRHEHGPFDLAVCLTNSLSSKLVVRMTGAKRRVGVARNWTDLLLTDPIALPRDQHQAAMWNQMLNEFLGTDYAPGPAKLYAPQPHRYARPTAGINPGAAYGSAKRWSPPRFAEVAAELADRFDLVIFGGAKEVDMAREIAALLEARGIHNFENLAGRTTIPELIARIAGLKLFVTNDSGPMHIAGALAIPSVAIFGSTNHRHTSQWQNARSTIIRKDVPCAPCMQRTCPLGHHDCMQQIHPQDVLAAAWKLVA